MRIQIQLLIKMIRICDYCQWTLRATIMSVYGPPWVHFEPLKLLLILTLMRIRNQLFTPAETRNAHPISQNNAALVGPLYASQFSTYQTYRTDFAGDHLIDVTYLDFPLAPRHPRTFLLLPQGKIMYRYIFEGSCI
jgi:hypothetical protein